ncbi:MAG: trigger factor [Acidimicrobiaceae bacterium]|nr:trigger factor [Acidimicrobiaceae bacterium]
MHTSIETLGGNLIRIDVEVDETELETEIAEAFKRISRNVRIPGFRLGRTPRRVLEAKLGSETGRAEAFRVCLPKYYRRAVIECAADVISNPEIQINSGQQSGSLKFSAEVQVRPKIFIADYENLKITIPNPTVEPEEVDAEVTALRRQFAELSTVSRPAIDGDRLKIDINCTVNGDTLDNLTAADYDYELGVTAASDTEKSITGEIDKNLRGSKAGDILDFHAEHPDPDCEDHLRFKVIVKEVRETILPPLTDEFVAANSECKTEEELRATIRANHSAIKKSQAVNACRNATNTALADLVQEAIPEVMIESVMKQNIDSINKELSNQGATLDKYLASLGQSENEFLNDLRQQAEQVIKLDLALRAVATAEGLEASDEDLTQEISSTLANTTTPETIASKTGQSDLHTGGFNDNLGEESDAKTVDGRDKPENFATNKNMESAFDSAATENETTQKFKALQEAGMATEMKAVLSKQAAMRWINERSLLVDHNGAVIESGLIFGD